jgi:hypothetical protein
MKIEQIKKEMKSYEDFYGGDFLDTPEIDNATTFIELAGIIRRHSEHIESMERDAQKHLNDFKKRLGLSLI